MRYFNNRTNYGRNNILEIIVPLPVIFSEEQELKSKLEKKGWQIFDKLIFGQSSPIEKLLVKTDMYDSLDIADKDIKDMVRILRNSTLPHTPLFVKKIKRVIDAQVDETSTSALDRYSTPFSGYMDYTATTITGSINKIPENMEDTSLVYNINELYKKYLTDYLNGNLIVDTDRLLKIPFSKCTYIKNISHPELGFEFSISFKSSEFGYYNTTFNIDCRKIVKSEIYENPSLSNILLQTPVTTKRFSLFEK